MSTAYAPDAASVNGLSGLTGAIDTFASHRTRYITRVKDHTSDLPDYQATYAMYRTLADNNNPYAGLKSIMGTYGLGDTAMQGLRNPANAICAFYEATLWPGTIREDDAESALPLGLPQDVQDALAANLRNAIHYAWRESNLNTRKDTLAYECANVGDVLFKVRSDTESTIPRVWFETILPDYLTDFTLDGRGYLTYVRLDVPQRRRLPDGTSEGYTHTEIWDKDAGTFRVWTHKQHGATTIVAVDQLGRPDEDGDEAIVTVVGNDFVPFILWRWDERSDEDRGISALARSYDKIIYGDALVTQLHQRLGRHNRADKALVSQAFGSDNTPLAPVKLNTDTDGTIQSIEVNGEQMWVPPPGYDIRDMVADLRYADHLAVVEAHYKALMHTDAPELAWYEVSEAGGNESGRALDYKLTPAKAKVEKARGRAEAELIRITQMCLSVGQFIGVPGFSVAEIGTWDANSFDFWIGERPIVPMSRMDDLAVEQARANVAKTLTDGGFSHKGAVQVAGYEDADADLLERGDFETQPEPVPPQSVEPDDDARSLAAAA